MRSDTDTAAASIGVMPSALLDYVELTKPSVVWLILMSTVVGFYLGSSDTLPVALLLHTLIATALLAGGTGALNQWWERVSDAKMRRTENRPLPAGRIGAAGSLGFGLGISAAGLIYLFVAVNQAAFWLGVFTLASYVLIYTPLKYHTHQSTFIGAFPGAIPPLLGWAAVRGEVSIEGLALYAILFLWQFPHFYAIAWMYRDDYARAGIRMLPVVQPDGVSTARQIIAYGIVLIPVSLTPTLLGMTGWVYFGAALLLGLGYLYYGIRTARARTVVEARKLLQASVIYLPVLYLFLVISKQ